MPHQSSHRVEPNHLSFMVVYPAQTDKGQEASYFPRPEAVSVASSHDSPRTRFQHGTATYPRPSLDLITWIHII